MANSGIEFDSATPESLLIETVSSSTTTTVINTRLSSSSSVQSTNIDDAHHISKDDIKAFQQLFRKTITEDVINGTECKRLLDKLRRCSSKYIQKLDAAYSDEQDLISNINQLVDNDHCLLFFNNYLKFGRNNIELLVNNTKKRQFINILKLCLSFWNLTHNSENVCARMVKLEIHLTLIRLLSDLIKTMNYNLLFGDDNNNTLLLLTMSLIGILHNINRKLQYTRAEFRKEGLVDNLMELTKLTSGNKLSEDNNNIVTKKNDMNQQSLMQLRTALLLLLAFLVNEDENSVLNATDEHLVYFIGILKETVNSDIFYSSCHGYHCLEILHGLRHIAAPDCNKRTLIAHGILSLIGVILGPVKAPPDAPHNTDDEIMAGALELLWSLSFSRDCVLALDANNCELRVRIEQLATTSNSAVMLAARGTLWNLGSTLTMSTMTATTKAGSFNSLIRKDSEQNLNIHDSGGSSSYNKGHIMISYQHSTQDMMIRIKESLIDAGYKVWMDVDHMTGSFVDAMAEGIQHASVLVLGLCQAFKNSPHCRQEVKYAYTLGIPLVPVLLEAGFVADGWLGLMCATLIYTEFHQDGPNEFTENMRQLQKQVGNRGKLPSSNATFAPTNGLSQQISNIMTDSLDEKSTTTTSFRQPSCDLMCCSTEEPSHRQRGVLNQIPIQHSVQANQINSLYSTQSDYPDHSIRSNHSLPSRNRSHIEEKMAPPSSCHYCILDRQKTSILISDQDHSSALSHLTKIQILNWSITQTIEWLENHLQLTEVKQKTTLSQLNGELLLELVDLRRSSPELFFKTMMKYEELSLIDTLKLSTGLRQLDALPIS